MLTWPEIAAVRSLMPSKSTVAVSFSSTVTLAEVSSKPYSSVSKPEMPIA